MKFFLGLLIVGIIFLCIDASFKIIGFFTITYERYDFLLGAIVLFVLSVLTKEK